jgi:maltose phosphorylase
MAGTWLAIVEGFGRMRIYDGKVVLNPLIPSKWQSYSFHSRFRGILFEVKVTKNCVCVRNNSRNPLDLIISGEDYKIEGSGNLVLNLNVDFFLDC